MDEVVRLQEKNSALRRSNRGLRNELKASRAEVARLCARVAELEKEKADFARTADQAVSDFVAGVLA